MNLLGIWQNRPVDLQEDFLHRLGSEGNLSVAERLSLDCKNTSSTIRTSHAVCLWQTWCANLDLEISGCCPDLPTSEAGAQSNSNDITVLCSRVNCDACTMYETLVPQAGGRYRGLRGRFSLPSVREISLIRIHETSQRCGPLVRR